MQRERLEYLLSGNWQHDAPDVEAIGSEVKRAWADLRLEPADIVPGSGSHLKDWLNLIALWIAPDEGQLPVHRVTHWLKRFPSFGNPDVRKTVNALTCHNMAALSEEDAALLEFGVLKALSKERQLRPDERSRLSELEARQSAS